MTTEDESLEPFLEEASLLLDRADKTMIAAALKDARNCGIADGFEITTRQINREKVREFYVHMRSLGRSEAEAALSGLDPDQIKWLHRRLKATVAAFEEGKTNAR